MDFTKLANKRNEPLFSNNTDMIMTPEIELTLQYIAEGRNVFVNGKAGTGKSHLIKWLEDNCNKSIAITSPTGISAININGSTIHSFFGINPYEKDMSKFHERNWFVRKKLLETDIIIIDEISMVRADTFDIINIICKANLNNPKPFGGKQIICFGDLSQLPPVLTDEDYERYYEQYDGLYFFDSMSFDPSIWSSVELKKIFRQNDQEFIDLLNNVRDSENIHNTLTKLNERVLDVDESTITTLVPYKKQEREINQRRLNMIKGKSETYSAKIKDKFPSNKFPVEEHITLKVGALVMTTMNDKDKGIVNGSIGIVEDLTETEITVRIIDKNNERTVKLNKWKWENYEYKVSKGKMSKTRVGTFLQFPVQLAWAMTIHKSQGKTMEKLLLDKGRGMFANGQTYVALSRCTSFEGLYLSKPLDEEDIF